MKSTIGIALLSLFPAGALCLSKRSCTSFEPQGKYGNKGYTMPSLKTFRTSEYINCTTELAREKGDKEICETDRYTMGLTLNSTVNVSVSDIQPVLDAVKQAASSDTRAKINLNETVLTPYRVTKEGIPAGEAGAIGPDMLIVGKENVVQSNSDELKKKPQPTWEEVQEKAEKEKDDDKDNSASSLTGNVLGSGIWGCVVWTVTGALWGLM
ncbi:hypothetical protein NCS52_00841900 [Fusarium sp. LHS14.1]|nr:hypothetical protein NCS52_00841900 [Fusarium sp. LHS14.1]